MSHGQNVTADRFKKQKPSVWVTFSKMANDTKSVNLGQGFPDFMPPEEAIKCLQEAVAADNFRMHQYTRGFGHPSLVNALAQIYTQQFGWEVNPLTEVLISNGAYASLYCGVNGLVNAGDEVIIIEPFFDCYEPIVEAVGGVPVFVPLRPNAKAQNSTGAINSEDFEIDFEELASKFTSKTKMLIINSPNNPLGKVFTEAELAKVAELCVKHDILVLSDQVYEWLVYPPFKPLGLPRLAKQPGMASRTVTIGSVGKTLSATGWKLGWAVGPPNLLEAMQLVHQNMVYVLPTVLQEASGRCLQTEVDRLEDERCLLRRLPAELLPIRDRLAADLVAMGLQPIVPQGGYFMMVDVSKVKLPDDVEDGTDDPIDFKLSRWLMKNRQLATIPSSAFYNREHRHLGDKYLRLCFVKAEDTLEKGIIALRNWTKESV